MQQRQLPDEQVLANRRARLADQLVCTLANERMGTALLTDERRRQRALGGQRLALGCAGDCMEH
jgi:hypothetical protein